MNESVLPTSKKPKILSVVFDNLFFYTRHQDISDIMNKLKKRRNNLLKKFSVLIGVAVKEHFVLLKKTLGVAISIVLLQSDCPRAAIPDGMKSRLSKRLL